MIVLSYLFTAILSMTVIGSLLFLALLPLSALAETKLSPQWNFHMHLVVLSFFIVPIGSLISYLLPLVATWAQQAPIQSPLDLGAVSTFMLHSPLLDPSIPAFSWISFFKEYSPMLWMIGMLVFALFYGIQEIRFRRQLHAKSTAVTSGFAYDELQAQKKTFGIKKDIHLLSHPSLTTPILTGIRTCYLILPQHWKAEKEIIFSINHELTHVKNNDLLIKKIVRLIHGIHWFNPLFFLFRQRLHLVIEYRCDKQIATSLDQSQRKEYAHAILSAMAIDGWDGSLCSGLGSKKTHVKRRISNMMKDNKPGKILKLLSVVLVVALVGTGVWLGISRKEEAPPIAPSITSDPTTSASGLDTISAKPDESPNPVPTIPENSEAPTEQNAEKLVVGEFQEAPFAFTWPTLKGGYVSAKVDGFPSHTGMDIAGNGGLGYPVYASYSGVVLSALNGYNGYGNFILIDHGDGWQTLYAHMDELHVKVDDEVKTGDQIGTVGRTGRVTGPCLHFEIRKDGIYLDGEQYVKSS